jgi:hypothetical protein
MELGNHIYLSSVLFGGPDNSLSGWPKATGGRPENAHGQFVNKRFASCALEMSSSASGQQVARTTQNAHTEVIVLGEEH